MIKVPSFKKKNRINIKITSGIYKSKSGYIVLSLVFVNMQQLNQLSFMEKLSSRSYRNTHKA